MQFVCGIFWEKFSRVAGGRLLKREFNFCIRVQKSSNRPFTRGGFIFRVTPGGIGLQNLFDKFCGTRYTRITVKNNKLSSLHHAGSCRGAFGMPKKGVIDFSTDMVRAILAGKKTVFRRFMRSQPADDFVPNRRWAAEASTPFGQKGDVVFVREAFHVCENHPELGVIYKADSVEGEFPETCTEECGWVEAPFMPLEYVRIKLRILSITVAKLQDIQEEDAKNEGVPLDGYLNAVEAFKAYWIYLQKWKKVSHHWESNPWVWVVKFNRVRRASPVRGRGLARKS
jgi:hypothetical protein